METTKSNDYYKSVLNTKTEIGNALSLKTNITYLGDYYTKTEIDTLFTNYNSKSYIDVLICNY